MTVFFTGCTHFDHDNIIRLAGRPFDNVQEMNETLVERWNAKVRPTDFVYHLGDVAWSNIEQWFDRLNGRKTLILGNQDSGNLGARSDLVGICPYREISIASTRFVLFHYPIDDWNGRWRGSIHLHCHTHAKQFRNPNIPYLDQSPLALPDRYPPDIRYNRFNVGVDACDFAPVSVDEILDSAIAMEELQ
jgi:calcineurin-like phosphoesterase family protein